MGRQKQRILIIDDVKLIREELKDIFQGEYELLEAEDGVDGLKELKENKGNIDLILLDLAMPNLDGIEVLKKRKETSYLKNIPVIVITSNLQPEYQIAAFELDATDYITKPFIPDVVRFRVEHVLASRKRIATMEAEARELKIKSQMDLMTGLYNKATSEKIISEVLARFPEQNHAMLVMDIDNFKAINDMSGHLMGDHTIRVMASMIVGTFFKKDVVGRIGGDEFIVFMINIGKKDAVKKKVNKIIETLYHKTNLSIPENASLSIGFATTEGKKHTFVELFDKADQALHIVKRSGKAQAWEYGVEPEYTEDLEDKSVVILSENRGIRSMIRALMPKDIYVKDQSTTSELKEISVAERENICLVYVDSSDVKNNKLEEFWLDVYANKWLKRASVIALCEEGNLKQMKAAIDAGVDDILSVPIETSVFKRRTAKYLGNFINEKK